MNLLHTLKKDVTHMSKVQELKALREKNGNSLGHREFSILDKTATLGSYYENIMPIEEINKAVDEYKVNLDKVSDDFKRKTKLQDKDIVFLIFATILQCARIYLINNITKIEKAGTGNSKEDLLHKVQNKVLSKFDNGIVEGTKPYHAPLNQIITNRGVPYDATAFFDEKFNLFKGANHRFATLGHDPVFGLIFGTANIMTNTITCINKPIITTNHVIYDDVLKNPKIGSFGSTVMMFDAVIKRIEGDKSALAAAIIKQLIHIGTDLYTPCGIQLPGANLILSKDKVEELTKYISTGDVFKFFASAGLDILINTIISAVHSSKLLFEDDGSDFSKELYSIRTRKIILYSNLFATSSNVIAVGITGNLKQFDLGGFAVTCYRLFSDTKFFDKIKYEFLNSQVSKIYEEKMADNLLYYA